MVESRNSKLVFDFGNQYVKEKDSAPFFGLPAWWRRFMFQILTPREVTVYLYLCSVMDQNAVAYPTIEQIAEDMAVKSRSIVVEAVNRLVATHFVLRSGEPYVGRIMGKRTVYQRPLPHYTILELLKSGLIDENLYPVDIVMKKRNYDLTSASDEVVKSGLKRLIGATNYAAFEMLKVPERRRRALIAALQQHVDKARTFDAPRVTAVQLATHILNVSGEMQTILREELDELNEAVPF